MKLRFLCLCVCGMLTSLFAVAQENVLKRVESQEPGQGRITLHQDAAISALIGKRTGVVSSESNVLKMPGYRVQVYAGGNSRTSKTEAESTGGKVRAAFPDFKVYTSFLPPRWLCRVGDFLSIEEADAAMRRLRKEGGFREATIVKEQVNIYL